jgi:anti-sigma B factor antagonist
VNVLATGDRCELLVSGELDLLTANLVAELGTINLESCQSLVIDLKDVSFMDGRGLRALLELRQVALETGKSVTVANPHPRVRTVLSLAGLEGAFGAQQPGSGFDTPPVPEHHPG